MAQASTSTTPQPFARSKTDSSIARLLGHRFGDGLVYFRDEEERSLFGLAIERGLLSQEGYLTPEGHSFLMACGGD